MPVKVKICGITRAHDALAAVSAGADAIGLMFYEQSRRNISVTKAREIVKALPPFISKVGVFVNADAETIKRIVSEVGIDTLQLHGEETPEFCRQFEPLKVIKAFRIQSAKTVDELLAYDTDAWLLDTYNPGQHGGTGETFDWNHAIVAKEAGTPIILAGGLTPENIAEAVHEVWPYGVDVSSGVESAPGIKDDKLIASFVSAIRTLEVEKL